MSAQLEKILSNLDLENLTILEVSTLLKDAYDLPLISKTMSKVRRKKELCPPNAFGNCGINPEIDPCGDACEY
jgi:hypothetical protein